MTALLEGELLKLRTTRTFVVFVALSVGTSVLIAGLVAVLTEPTEDTVLVDVFASDTSSFFVLVLAVVGISGEWRHRTITSSLLAEPDRTRFLAAKTIAYAVTGVVLSAATALAVTTVGAVILGVRDLPIAEAGEIAAQSGRNMVVALLLGAFGVAIGALVRNQIAAVVGLLVASFVIEPLVLALEPGVGRFGPMGALPAAAAGFDAEDVAMGDVELLGVVPAGLAMAAWIAVTFTAAAVLLHRRDLD